jgi:hypothetical protein
MILPVMGSAQWNHELIAGFAAQRSRLSKAEMMRIGRRAATHQARLQRDKSQMGFIPMSADFAELENALVDFDDGRCIQVSRGGLARGPQVGGIANFRRRRSHSRLFDRRRGFSGPSPRLPRLYGVRRRRWRRRLGCLNRCERWLTYD